jgi:DNA invertase Pin-like site-specific DNA recombinase
MLDRNRDFLTPPEGQKLFVVSYDRASLDRSGAESSVRSQQFERERFLESRPSWELLASYGDNSKSAAKTSVVRDEFERMMVDIETGLLKPHLILVLDLSRLFRNRRDKGRLVALIDSGVHIYDMRFGFCTADQPAGRIIFEIMGELAIDRAEELAEHQRRHADREKAAGNPPLTGKVGFGHRRIQAVSESGEIRVAFEIVAEEAKAIRWATSQILGGASWNSCVKAWADPTSEYYVETREGGKWHLATMKQILLSARIAGCRERIMADAAGKITTQFVPNKDGRLPAIITVDELLRLRELATMQRLRFNAGGGVRRGEEKHLVSGIACCGRCGKPRMNASRSSSGRRGAYRYYWGYHCKNCGKISIVQSFVDEFVKHATIEVVRTGAIAAAVQELADVAGASGVATEIALQQERLREFQELNKVKPVSAAAYLDFVSAAEQRIEEAQRQLTTRLRDDHGRFASSLPSDIAETIEARWDDPETSMSWKRGLVKLCFEKIIIHKTKPGKRDLPGRIQLIPRVSFVDAVDDGVEDTDTIAA